MDIITLAAQLAEKAMDRFPAGRVKAFLDKEAGPELDALWSEQGYPSVQEAFLRHANRKRSSAAYAMTVTWNE